MAQLIVRKGYYVAMLCCTFLVLAGCWDKKELNEVAVVMGVGIDKGENRQIRLTAQVIKPNPKERGVASGGSEIPTWSLTASARTVLDAVNQLNRISPRRLYWPHTQIIIFGEDLAKEGLAPVLTYFERDKDARSGAYVAVTHGTAEDLLNQRIELGSIPAKAMADLFEKAEKRQLSVRAATLRQFAQDLITKGIDPTIDVIDPKKIREKKETYQISQIAVFKDDQLKGFLSPDEATGISMASGKYKGSIFPVPCPGSKQEYITFLATDFQRRGKPSLNQKQIVMKYNVFIEGNIGDQNCGGTTMDQAFLSSVNQNLSEKVKQMLLKGFNNSKKFHSDAYGIGREIYRYLPNIWSEKMKTNYLDNVKLDITVEASVRRSGLIFDPTASKFNRQETKK